MYFAAVMLLAQPRGDGVRQWHAVRGLIGGVPEPHVAVETVSERTAVSTGFEAIVSVNAVELVRRGNTSVR